MINGCKLLSRSGCGHLELGGCLRWHYPLFWLRLRKPFPSSLSSWDQPGMVRTHPLIAHKQTGFESQGLRTRQPARVTSSHCGTSRFCSRLCRLSERDYTTPTMGHALCLHGSARLRLATRPSTHHV